MRVQRTLRYSDRLALEVSTASPRKNQTPLLKLSYFLKAMETYERKFPVVHDSIQDPLVLQLIEEVNKLKAEDTLVRWPGLGWFQPGINQGLAGTNPGLAISQGESSTPFSSEDKTKVWFTTLYWKRGPN
ncbi:hypothetical protein ACFX19_019752 [Malus domestica]